MFFILSKLLSYLIQPLLWVVALLVLAALRSRQRRGWLLAALATLLLLTNRPLANACLGWWEAPVVPLAALDAPYDVAVVLGGATQGLRTPADRVYAGQAIDRLLHTAQLYQQEKVRKILLTGGGQDLLGRPFHEADDMARVLQQCGVPPTAVWREGESLNTHQNAVRSAALLRTEGAASGRLLLVTSAFHMRRSLATFRRQGLDPTPFPVDFRAQPLSLLTPDQWIVPSGEALAQWALLLREVVGLLTYRLLGYA